MKLWFSEEHTKNVQLSIRISEHIFHCKSDFQTIDIFMTPEFGRILVLDGYLMLTEKDEFIYHEMIVHVPMAVKSSDNILVIGAGDGGVIKELIKYKSIKKIDVVEIDELVVKASKKFLYKTAFSFEDNRVNLYYQDGLKFIRNCHNIYDLIIVDSTDPFGPGEGLFSKEFYGNCFNALTKDGILVNQHESPFYENDCLSMKKMHKCINEFFKICKLYQAHIPTYPSGHWLFGFASKSQDPIKNLNEIYWNSLNIKTKYYNTKIHVGSFYLPTYVKDELKEKC